MYTIDEAADILGTTPRSLRRFIRKHRDIEPVGVGGRYLIEESTMEQIKQSMEDKAPKKVAQTYEWEGEEYPAISIREARHPKKVHTELYHLRQARLLQLLHEAGVQ